MEGEQFQEIVKKQLNIEADITSEFQKFKKNNSERKAQVAEVLWLKIEEFRVSFDTNNNLLSAYRSEFINQPYFKDNVYARVSAVFTEFLSVIKSCRNEKKYSALRDSQVELQDELLKLSEHFNKLNGEEKVAEKDNLLLTVENLKQKFKSNHSELEVCRSGREHRSYFCQDNLSLFNNKCEILKTLIETFIVNKDDVEDSSSSEDFEDDNKARTPSSKMGTEERTAKMEEALTELIKLNVSKTNNVQSLCSKFIIKFDSKNVRSFLNSLQDCVEECKDEDEVKKVLRYAKNRVTNNAIVSATEFDSYEEFERLMNQQFKPVKDHLQVNHEISMLLQKKEESVTQYGARAVLLKVEYVEALYCYYKSMGEALPLSRMAEAEALATKHFVLGLKQETKINIRSEPKSLTEAIGFAQAAATAAGLADVSRNFADRSNFSNSKGNRGNFRGASRGGRGGYGQGRQWNNGSGFSGHNSASGAQNDSNTQSQSGSNNSRGCWRCGDENHRKADCPNKATVSKVGRGGSAQPKNRQFASSVQGSAQAMQNVSQHDSE